MCASLEDSLIEMFTICAFNEFDCVHISVSLTKQADFNCSLFPSIVKESRFHNTRFNPKVRSFAVSSCAVFLLFLSFRIAHPQREIHVLRCVFFNLMCIVRLLLFIFVCFYNNGQLSLVRMKLRAYLRRSMCRNA